MPWLEYKLQIQEKNKMGRNIILSILISIPINILGAATTELQIDPKLNEPIESLWLQIKSQREDLEDSSKKEKMPLREVLTKEEFKLRFPLLPYGQEVDSQKLGEGIELRIATIPKNVNRKNLPYSIVAILFQATPKKLETRIIPDTLTNRRILNISSNWDFAEPVTDFPKIRER